MSLKTALKDGGMSELFPASLLFEVESSDHAYRVVRNAHAFYVLMGIAMFFVYLLHSQMRSALGFWITPVAATNLVPVFSSILPLRNLLKTLKISLVEIRALFRTFYLSILLSPVMLVAHVYSDAVSKSAWEKEFFIPGLLLMVAVAMSCWFILFLMMRRLARRCEKQIDP